MFEEEGTVRTLLPKNRLLLHDCESVFCIEKGSVDVYFLELQYFLPDYAPEKLPSTLQRKQTLTIDAMEGLLSFLFSVRPGELLFPFPLPQTKPFCYIVAIAEQEVTFRELPLATIRNKLTGGNYESSEELTLWAQQGFLWLERLSEAFPKIKPPLIDSYIEPDQIVLLNPGETAQLAREISVVSYKEQAWLSTDYGTLIFMGISSIALSSQHPPFPLLPSIWITAQHSADFKVLVDPRWPFQWKFWEGLLYFNHCCLSLWIVQVQYRSLEEQLAIVVKNNYQVQLLKDTYSSMKREFVRQGEAPWESNSTLWACKVIGWRLKQKIIDPDEELPDSIDRQVELIAYASSLYWRKVFLTEKWWLSDSGPLLGIWTAGKKLSCVPLLPDTSGGYISISSKTGEQIPVNQTFNRQLAPTAYMFYRQYPQQGSVKAIKIAQFAFHGRLKDIIVAAFATLLSMGAGFMLPFVAACLFDYVIPNSDIQFFWQLISALILLAVSSIFFIVTREVALLRLESLCFHDLEAAMWQRVFSLPVLFFKHSSEGALFQQIEAFDHIRTILSGRVIHVILNFIFASAFIFIMFYYSVLLSVTCLALFVVIIPILIACGHYVLNLSERASKLWISCYDKIVHMVSGITKIRTNGAEIRIFADWTKTFFELKVNDLLKGKKLIVLKIINMILPEVVFLAIFAVLTILLSKNPVGTSVISLGSYIAFIMAFTAFYLSFIEIQSVVEELMTLLPGWEWAKKILNVPVEHINVDYRHKAIKLTGKIVVEHLYFRYSPSGAYIHEDISLYAEPGEFIAIVGYSGSGKTSLLRLMLGFEMPEHGGVFYNDRSLRDINLQEMRKQIGVVLQNSELNQGTIRDNIVVGRTATEQQIEEAIKMACFEQDLATMPMGLNTPVGDRGINFSGGQRQRLILARALLGSPKILFLDEATNALDNITQEVISRNLDHYFVTRIIIAHRLSTIYNAHRIYVLDKGKIVQVGSFHELAAQEGLFADFIAQQKL